MGVEAKRDSAKKLNIPVSAGFSALVGVPRGSSLVGVAG